MSPSEKAALFTCFGIFFLITQVIVPNLFSAPNPLNKLQTSVKEWLLESHLEDYAQHLFDNEVSGLFSLIEMPPPSQFISVKKRKTYLHKISQLRQQLIFQHYFEKLGVDTFRLEKVQNLGLKTFREVNGKTEEDFISLVSREGPMVSLLLNIAQWSEEMVVDHENSLWNELAERHGLPSAGTPDTKRHTYRVPQSLTSPTAALVSLLLLLGVAAVSLIHLEVVRDPLDLQVVTAGNPECHCHPPPSTTLGRVLCALSPKLCPLHHCLLPPLLNHPTFYFGYLCSNLLDTVFKASAFCCLVCAYAFFKIVPGMTGSYREVLSGELDKRKGYFHYFLGRHIHHKKCLTTFNWEGKPRVGTTVTFEVKFFQRNGRAYPISDADKVKIEVKSGYRLVSVVTELGGAEEDVVNRARCSFTTRYSGDHTINITVANAHVMGSPFTKTFRPGPLCLDNTTLSFQCSTFICEAGAEHCFLVEPRDEYHNLCSSEDSELDAMDYKLNVYDVNSSNSSVESNSVIHYSDISRRYTVTLLLEQPGCYHAELKFKKETLPQGKFSIIALSEEENEKVAKTMQRRSTDSLEAFLVGEVESPDCNSKSSNVSPSNNSGKWRKIYCQITPKQLILKEYVLWVIPKRLYTFRLCPYTKLLFSSYSKDLTETSHSDILTIDDGCQKAVTIASKDRSVIAASFSKFMLRNIGGSETFKDKQTHFYYEVRKFHCKKQRAKLTLKINRENLLESSMKATKHFSVTDWLRSFEIVFNKEEGLDWGGVSREWVEVLCTQLFDPKGGLFTSFNEDGESSPQSLVHPNPSRPANLKLKYYEFAGKLVGKCLYECAKGFKNTLLVKARFTRSFLAQIIGLRVSYKHFEHDDPELYSGKVQHLLKHGVDLLPEPIYFTDSYKNSKGELKTVDLETGGSTKQVTNENIAQYLDALAQCRLANRVSAEVSAFMNGFNELIPDNLLCIFDENELELLMCGTEEYSITDMQNNHVVTGTNTQFKRLLYWFWTAIANFTEEEMARLLQFITGCSRLPPGGFSQLSPQLQISPSPMYNSLPMAHTCFNQLCLPDYDSYEQLEKCLLIAIKEGSEGFGLV